MRSSQQGALSIGFIVPFGELSPSFFPDTLVAQLCANARRAGHRAEIVRVYYDGRRPEVDAEVDRRLAAWLGERRIELVVAERYLRVEPLRSREAGPRTLVLVSRGDSFDPIDGIEYVVGGNTGMIRSGGTRRSPSAGELALAFDRLVTALASGADASMIPGVNVVRDGELLPASPLERPSTRPPFEATVDMDVIAEGPPPAVTRKTVFGNVGCPYAADPLEQPHFHGVRLPTSNPVARLGCSFCALGGDYEKRPDADVVAEIMEQARFWAERVPTVDELVLADQYPVRYLRALMTEARSLRPLRWLFAARSDTFVRDRVAIRAAIEAARESGQFLELYLTGFETFCDAELRRYNKGVSAAEQVAAVQEMRALAREFPLAFGYAGARGHSLVLWSPWTTPEDVRESVDVIRREGLAELFHEVGRNRLRLYRDLPIYYAAERDGALLDDWAPGDEGAGQRKGYNAEHPWRFLDPRTHVCHALAAMLRERLGMQTELAQLAAASDYAGALERAAPDVDSIRRRVLSGIDALDAALGALTRPRTGDGRPPARVTRAAVVEVFGPCNNGCVACANRERWTDSTHDALLARVRAARMMGTPLVIAGREPTLLPGLRELVRVAAGDDRRPVAIVTNGRRFASPAFTMQLVAAGLQAASVKLFAADAATADEITRDAGGHGQALAGIRNLRAAGLPSVEARLPLHARGLASLRRAPAVAAAAGATQLRLEAPLDAIGLDALDAAAQAVAAVATECTRLGMSLVASDLRAGARLFDVFPG